MKIIMESLALTAGIICVTVYYLVSSKKIRAEGWPYNLAMLFVSGSYFVYSIYLRAYSMMTLNAFFIIVSIKAIRKDLLDIGQKDNSTPNKERKQV